MFMRNKKRKLKMKKYWEYEKNRIESDGINFMTGE